MPEVSASDAVDLSASGTANSYIVSKAGAYRISPVKGNSSESVGPVASVTVLWESFGTDDKPARGELIKAVKYQDKSIYFLTGSQFKEGNAVIAAKDESGRILWSWHIWMTDTPDEQVYNNDAGTMMDRNLGATSAQMGQEGSYGLLYQWGRKDPFLGAYAKESSTKALSTAPWPSAVISNQSTGTISYVTEHPMTFVKSNKDDWQYNPDNTRWQSEKTIYDPCPVGWRVPDGGEDGVWAVACESFADFEVPIPSVTGMTFETIFGPEMIWYPASGFTVDDDRLTDVGVIGSYWSVSDEGGLFFEDTVKIMMEVSRYYGRSVRCFKEGSGSDGSSSSGTVEINPSSAVSLAGDGTANSYIVSSSGTYSLPTVKGSTSESVGSMSSVEVLWESFGTSVAPKKGNLIAGAIYEGENIYFKTATVFREGNAVIAAKDASGKILWSWHIWMTDKPQVQAYNNGAGNVMDRNLGATSATAGDVGALGLLYQWGRKDPFLGSASISESQFAQSTLTWPSAVASNSTSGTVDYVTAHPTTFVKGASAISYDWHYASRDDGLWAAEKTIYDPCPAGWRVPDGGDNGLWSTAGFTSSTYEAANEGIHFDISSPSTTWYPAAGSLSYDSAELTSVGNYGYYWSVTPYTGYACYLYFFSNGSVNPANDNYRSYAFSVRCVEEGSSGDGSSSSDDVEITTSTAVSLSDKGLANCYIVSQAGTYSIYPFKGNTTELVGSVSSAEVLWESFGTDVAPSTGDLIAATKYENGKIYFKTPATYREGNAVIAAKDASGTILWSWHIWLTDMPKEQVYYNSAGTMMDRNLGATSATPGDVGALGLLYQWGRKDPFLGSSSISKNMEAKCNVGLPDPVNSNMSNGTIEYATANPTTFILYNAINGDWYFTGSASTDDTRWQSEKTIYDPCPTGWRVPDGGENGVWSKALGSSSDFSGYPYDDSNCGMDFSDKLGADQVIWYPTAGRRYFDDGTMSFVGRLGSYWSVTPNSNKVFFMDITREGSVWPSDSYDRVQGFSVRCFKESL